MKNSIQKVFEIPSNTTNFMGGFFFNYEIIKDLYSNSFFLKDNNFIIPVHIKKKFTFKYATFLSEPEPNVLSIDYQIFIDNCINYLKTKEKVDWIETTPAYSMFLAFPNGSKYIKWGNYLLKIDVDLEVIWNNFDPKTRNLIRKADKNNVIVKNSPDINVLQDFYKMLFESSKRNAFSIPNFNFFQNLIIKYPNNSQVFVSYYNGLPQNSAFIYFNKNIAYYMFGANKHNSFGGSSNFLHYHIIKFLKEYKVKLYSFVGARINPEKSSKYYGIQQFKASFGGALFESYLFKKVINKYKYILFKFLVSIKSFRISFFDVIDKEFNRNYENINH